MLNKKKNEKNLTGVGIFMKLEKFKEENKKRNLIIYSIPVTCDKIIFLGITVLYFFKNYSSIRISKFYKSENYEINDGLF